MDIKERYGWLGDTYFLITLGIDPMGLREHKKAGWQQHVMRCEIFSNIVNGEFKRGRGLAVPRWP